MLTQDLNIAYLVGALRPQQDFLAMVCKEKVFIGTINPPKEDKPKYSPVMVALHPKSIDKIKNVLIGTNFIVPELDVKAHLTKSIILITANYKFEENKDSIIYIKNNDDITILPRIATQQKTINIEKEELINFSYNTQFIYLGNNNFILSIINKYMKRLILPNMFESSININMVELNEKSFKLIQVIWPELELVKSYESGENVNQYKISMNSNFAFPDQNIHFIQIDKVISEQKITITSFA